MKRSIQTLFLLTITFSAFTLLSGFKGCAAGPVPVDQCESASDCEGLPSIECVGDWSCTEGMCIYECGFEPECKSDADCKAGEICGSGECLNIKPPTGCDSDSDCAPNQACISPACPPCAPDMFCAPCPTEGVCVDIEPPDACQSDFECGPGAGCETICSGGGFTTCVCAEGEKCDCPPVMDDVCFNVCVENPGPTCSGDYECGPNQHCEIEYCEDYSCDCGPDEDCDCPGLTPWCYGQCKDDETKTECSSDDECGEGMECSIEWCEDFGGCGACNDGDDDDDGDECDCMPYGQCYGTCVPKEADWCSSDAECGPGQECNLTLCTGMSCACQDDKECDCPDIEPECYGTCQDITPPPISECSADCDCADGEYCELPVCLMGCDVDDEDCCGDTEGMGSCQPLEPPPTECVASGCSGEICAAQPVAGICIYADWFVCLELSKCEATSNGCGWTQNPEFDACMAQFISVD